MSPFDTLAPVEVDFAVGQYLKDFVAEYENLTGKIIGPGDPRRVFFYVIASRLVQVEVNAQLEKRQTLLRYAPIEILENIGAERDVYRLAAEPAATTIQFMLSIPLTSATIIPAGIRVGPLNGLGDLYFATTEVLQIPAGATSGTVRAEATAAGESGNGFLPGQLSTLIDPLPYVQAVTNLTETAGGSPIEDVEAFRERIRTAPEGYSVAGPEGAYIFWAKTASAAIGDVSVTSPADMQVRVVPLLRGGEIPSQEVLDAVAKVLNARDIRPMTDKVTVAAPEVTTYDAVLTYKLPLSRQTETAVLQAAVNQAVSDYNTWQQSVLGRDIDPTELIGRIRNAGGIQVEVLSPVFTTVESDRVAKVGAITVTFGGLADG